MATYHLRRKEKAIEDRKEIHAILRDQKYLTLAMCRDEEPYLVSLNYGWDQMEGCFYFHFADAGKKIDFLRANPKVWGQVVEDRGYTVGECEHSFRCVMFWGEVEFIEELEGKRKALLAMIKHAEGELDEKRRAMISQSGLEKVLVGRLKPEGMTGKESPAKKKD